MHAMHQLTSGAEQTATLIAATCLLERAAAAGGQPQPEHLEQARQLLAPVPRRHAGCCTPAPWQRPGG